MEDIALLEAKVERLERQMGKGDQSVLPALESLNTKIDKMLGKYGPAVSKKLPELSTYTDPSFMMDSSIKTEYVAASDVTIKKAAKNAVIIDELKDNINWKSLKNVPEMSNKLEKLSSTSLSQSELGDKLNEEICELVTKYNGIISTLSEQFVLWNDVISEAERSVANAK